jgi:hypothetical protein
MTAYCAPGLYYYGLAIYFKRPGNELADLMILSINIKMYLHNNQNNIKLGYSNYYLHLPVEEPWNFQGRGCISLGISRG